MADSSLTQEQLETLLTELFVNMNNLDKTYYDMFYNTIPMDITLERYDENGVLQTYIVPNRAKDAQNASYIIFGTVEPNGNISGTLGQLYLNIENYAIYYKASSESVNEGWVKIYQETIFSNGNPLPVSLGGTGSNNFTGTGLVKASGTNSMVLATEGTDYLNPTSVTNYINQGISTHNNDNSAHGNIGNRISSAVSTHNSSASAHPNLQTRISSVESTRIGFPDYNNGTILAWNVEYTMSDDGWLFLQGGGTTAYTPVDVKPRIYINNTELIFMRYNNLYGHCAASLFIPIKKGTIVRAYGGNWARKILFFPVL